MSKASNDGEKTGTVTSIWGYFMIAYPLLITLGLGSGVMYILTRLINYVLA